MAIGENIGNIIFGAIAFWSFFILFSILSAWLIMKYVKNRKILYLLTGLVSLIIAIILITNIDKVSNSL